MESPRRLPGISLQVPESILSRRLLTPSIQNPDLNSIQNEVDLLVGNFIAQASDPTTLAALTAGGLAYRWGKMGVMGLRVGAYCNTPLRAASITFGLGAEVTAFEFTNRAIQTVGAHGRAPVNSTHPNLWNWSGPGGWKQSLIADVITFGALKGAGHLSRESNVVLRHGFASSAMVSGHQVSGALSITPRPEGNLAQQILHAEVTNLQLGAGTALTHTLAPGLSAYERSLSLSPSPLKGEGGPAKVFLAGTGEGDAPPRNSLHLFFPQTVTAGSPSPRPSPSRERGAADFILMMSSTDKKSGGRKDPTGRTRHPTLPPLPPPDVGGKQSLIGITDLPKINEALLHQARQAISSAPDLVELLQAYGGNLRKLERSLGREPAGAAPFVARFIAERILVNSPEGVDLSQHPIALMVAAAMASHYETIGDLIGNRIYRDLNRVYLLLGQDRKKNLFEAEKIILQNLERDPLNLWFIQLGLSVSRELAEENLAKKEVSYFEDLQEASLNIVQTWDKPIFRRMLYEKVVVKFRQNPLKFLWQVFTLYGFGMGLLFPHLGSFAEILRSTKRGAKGIEYAQKGPGLLVAYRNKTKLEINLYSGDYRAALEWAEPNSPLLKLAEYLEAQQKGDRFEEEIELETIPKLNPQAVKQTEALVKLEEKLAQSTVVGLEGIPGSAKTYLAVQLANKYKNEKDRWVFWYTLREGKKPDLKRALDHLAFFIQTQDSKNHRDLLSQVQEKSRVEDRIALLAPLLQKHPVYLFLDNFHVVLEDKEAVALIQKLVPLNIGRSKIITIIRRREDWLQKRGAQIFRREEMSFEEAQELYANLGILSHFTEAQMKEVYQLTFGRPMALSLLGELVRCGKEGTLAQALDVLREKENRAEVTKYLFDQIWDTLPVEQKMILQYLSLFRDPVPKEALVFLGQTDEARLKAHLIHLEETFLLEERHPGIFELHERYKNLTALHFPLEDSQEMHHRAAEFYRTTARHPRDFLEAAHHFFEAGEHDRSVKIMTKWIPLLLKRGYVERVEEFLNRFTDSVRLRREDRAAILLARGDLAHFGGETLLSLEHYKKALSLFRALDDDKSIGLVLSRIANAQDLLGDWELALKTYAKSLPYLRNVDDEKGMAQNYNNMGLIFHNHGDWTRAHQYFHQSLLIKEKLGDRKGIANTLYNLGLMERDRGDNAKAIEYLRKSLELHRELKTPDLEHIETIIQELEKG